MRLSRSSIKPFLAFAFATSALACNASDGRFYAGASGGQSRVVDDLVAQDLATIPFYQQADSSGDRTDQAWKVFGGYRLTPNLAIEAAYADLGAYTKWMSVLAGFRFGNTVRRTTTAYGVDVVGTFPLGLRLEALGRAGAYVADVKMDRSGYGIGGNWFSASRSDRNTVAHGGLGIQAAMNPRFKVRLEWERFFKTGSTFSGSAQGTQGTGRSDMDLWSLGASVSF